MTKLSSGLQVAVSAARRVVAGIGAKQWELPTPCADWTVADLVAHLVLGSQDIAGLLLDEPNPTLSEDDLGCVAQHGGDRLQLFDATTDKLVRAFAAEGVLQRKVTIPFGTVPVTVALHLRIIELLVHGWDLAVATGQVLDVPGPLAEAELTFSRSALQRLPAGRSPFDPLRTPPPAANALEQLVALLGRQVVH